MLSAKDFPRGDLTMFNMAALSLDKAGISLASVRAKGGSARDYFDQVLRQEAQLRQARPLPMPRRSLPMPGVHS